MKLEKKADCLTLVGILFHSRIPEKNRDRRAYNVFLKGTRNLLSSLSLCITWFCSKSLFANGTILVLIFQISLVMDKTRRLSKGSILLFLKGNSMWSRFFDKIHYLYTLFLHAYYFINMVLRSTAPHY